MCTLAHAEMNILVVTSRLHARPKFACTREISSKTAILSSMGKGTYICRNHLEKADEIIGQATPPLFHDFEGLELFRRELSKKFDSVI